MADNKSDNDTQRWRDKYFTLSEELEKKERNYSDDLNVLHRALVRISLAADGQDKELDKQLDSLRSLLRKEPVDQPLINSTLAQVENTLLRLEKGRSDDDQKGFAPLQALIEQLLKLKLSKSHQRALKHFSKSLASKDNQLNHYPALLNEYRRLQQDALTELLHKPQDHQTAPNSSQGSRFFSRLFGAKGNEKPQPPVDGAIDDVAPSATLDTQNAEQHSDKRDSSQQETETHEATPSVAQPLIGSDEAEPINNDNSEKHDSQETVIHTLADLLEQLPLAPDIRDRAEELRSHLVQLAAAGHLDQIISSTAELVINALEKSQQEFEQFLLALDQQLSQISHFLAVQGDSKTARYGATEQLNTLVRNQVGSISKAVGDAKDIGDLKVSVQSQLKSIVASMDDFIETESEREQRLEKQLQELQEQLLLAQSESQSIRKKLQSETLRALTDPLTGLPNREAFDERFSLERERFLRYKHPVSLAILDIDHFKQVNDNHGHLVGDRVLQTFALTVKKMIRNTDFFARFGGEEFVLIMPETNAAEAFALLDKIREDIASVPAKSLGTHNSITVSGGLANFKLGEKAEQLVERADKALYRAKDAGRNRVVAAES